jgi:hypothetical protein
MEARVAGGEAGVLLEWVVVAQLVVGGLEAGAELSGVR